MTEAFVLTTWRSIKLVFCLVQWLWRYCPLNISRYYLHKRQPVYHIPSQSTQQIGKQSSLVYFKVRTVTLKSTEEFWVAFVTLIRLKSIRNNKSLYYFSQYLYSTEIFIVAMSNRNDSECEFFFPKIKKHLSNWPHNG